MSALLMDESCRRCGSPTVLRTNRSTGETFVGCSTFPACRATRPASRPTRWAAISPSKRVVKAGGGDGFADVWKRDFFAWECNGKYKDLKAAYVHLLNYKDDLGNPPHLVVSDLDRIEIHTNFTSPSPVTMTVSLDDMAALVERARCRLRSLLTRRPGRGRNDEPFG